MRFFAVLLLLLSSTALAAPGSVRVLGPEEIAPRLSSFSIVDSRHHSEFAAGHLPKSQPMDWKDWTEERPNFWNYLFGTPRLWGKALSDVAELEERLSALGFTHDQTILVVGKPKEWGEEGRVAWNFLYWGAKEVVLLDGGYPAWEKAKLPVAKGEEPKLPPAKFKVTLRPERRALIPQVQNALGKRQLFDVRSEEEFRGKKMSGQKRGGRISDGQLVPVESLYTEAGKYVDAAHLRNLLPLHLQNPIAYCVGGVRSALFALLLEARLGILVANYDGSVWEWASDPSLPMH